MIAPKRVNIVQGERAVVDQPGVIISTLLGSCVAACIYDHQAKIGGMNHFLLPDSGGDQRAHPEELQCYGIHAMELLINEMLKRGAVRSRLKAHLYGGANIFNGLSAIGTANGEFARKFMADEGIPVGHVDLGGRHARKVEFKPYEGKARSSAVSDAPTFATKPKPTAVPVGGDLELF